MITCTCAQFKATQPQQINKIPTEIQYRNFNDSCVSNNGSKSSLQCSKEASSSDL